MASPNDHVMPPEDWRSALEDFEAETGPPDDPAAVPASPIPGPAVVERPSTVSLAELQAAGTEIDSYEAIAIVEALCRSFVDAGDRVGPADLEPSGVFINSVGAVSAVSAGRRDAMAAVQSVGKILLGILPEDDFLFLRERVISRATSWPPFYTSLEDLAQALAYYARPDQAELIQAVYLRWYGKATGRVVAEPERYAPPASRPRPVEVIARLDSAPAPAGRSWLRDVRVRGAILIGGLAVAGISLWAFTQRTEPPAAGQPSVGNLPSVSPPATFLPPPAAPAIAASIADALLAAPLSRPPVSASQKAPVVARAPLGVRQPQPPTPVGSTAPIPTAERSLPAGAVSRETPPTAADSPVVPRPAKPADFPAAPSQPYTSRDTDVVPPTVTYPQALHLLPVGFHDDDVLTIEIVVDERGIVDAIRATARPRTIGEYVVVVNGLSVAKSWRFRPATKQGTPVRYRLLIGLTEKIDK